MEQAKDKSSAAVTGTFKVSPEELSYQIQNYDTLSIWKSYRKQAALVVFLSVFFTVTFFLLPGTQISLFVIIALLVYVVLGIFVFQGKKWAIIATSVLYVVDKILAIFILGFFGIVGVLWLLAFLSFGYKAYRVEKEKNKLNLGVN